jgi:uncharacterized membrane protein
MFSRLLRIIKPFRESSPNKEDYFIFGIVLAMALLSLLSSLVLSVEALELAKNPGQTFSCDINAVLSCSTVALSDYSNMLGFPNSFLGLMFLPIFVFVALAQLMGSKLSRSFLFGVHLFAFGALLYAFALFFISSFLIGALCPRCLVVTFSSTVMFFAITHYNVKNDNLYLNKKISKWAKGALGRQYDILSLFIILTLLVAIIILKYGSQLFL